MPNGNIVNNKLRGHPGKIVFNNPGSSSRCIARRLPILPVRLFLLQGQWKVLCFPSKQFRQDRLKLLGLMYLLEIVKLNSSI